MKYKIIADASNKKTKIEVNPITFYLLFGCPMAKFAPLLSKQWPLVNVNH